MPRFTNDPLHCPPPHVLAEVDAAWERAQDLLAGEVELHFEVELLTGRPAAELRLPGVDEAWERLSASEALALACGDAQLVGEAHPHALVA